MANIVRRQGQQEGRGEVARGVVFEPFNLLRQLLRADPFDQLAPMVPLAADQIAFVPDFDVKETPDAYELKADLPGIRDSDVEITITGNRLVVTGRREREQRQEGDNYFALERAYGAFSRSFTLPEGVDADRVQANLSEGVLTLRIPKKPEAQPKKIELRPGQGGGQKAPPAKA
jgi:HSP20 family protein